MNPRSFSKYLASSSATEELQRVARGSTFVVIHERSVGSLECLDRDRLNRQRIGCGNSNNACYPRMPYSALTLRKEGCTTAAFDRAAMNNHVDVILWLTKHRTEGGTESALQWAVSRGHTKVGNSVSLASFAAPSLGLEVVKYLRMRHCVRLSTQTSFP